MCMRMCLYVYMCMCMCICTCMYVYVYVRIRERAPGWVMTRVGSCPEATVDEAGQLQPLSRLSMCLWLEATAYLICRPSACRTRLRPTGAAHFSDVTVNRAPSICETRISKMAVYVFVCVYVCTCICTCVRVHMYRLIRVGVGA